MCSYDSYLLSSPSKCLLQLLVVLKGDLFTMHKYLNGKTTLDTKERRKPEQESMSGNQKN